MADAPARRRRHAIEESEGIRIERRARGRENHMTSAPQVIVRRIRQQVQRVERRLREQAAQACKVVDIRQVRLADTGNDDLDIAIGLGKQRRERMRQGLAARRCRVMPGDAGLKCLLARQAGEE